MGLIAAILAALLLSGCIVFGPKVERSYRECLATDFATASYTVTEGTMKVECKR